MAVLVSDSFNRADSTTTLGNTDSYAGGSVYTWAKIGTAVWGISSNQAYTATTANDSPAYLDMTTQADNARVSVDINVSTSIYLNGIAFRVQDTNNYFRCYASNGSVTIARMLSGSATTIGSQTLTGVTAPFTLSVELTGSTIKAFVNGVLQITVTDTNFSAATKHGMYIGNGTLPRLDNFKIESLASGTAYTASLSDSITTSDTISKSIIIARVDTVTTSDARSGATAKTLSDAVTTSDSIGTTKGKAVNLSDSIAITDALSKAITLARSDAVSTSDSRSNAAIRKLLDSITQTDSIATIKGKAVLLTDSVSMTDTIRKAITRAISDSMAMSEAFSKTVNVSVQIYDVLVTSDSVQTFLPSAPSIVRTVNISGMTVAAIELKGEIIVRSTVAKELNGTMNPTRTAAEIRGEV